MTDQTITIPSYQGYLQNDTVTIPQLLKTAGYDTYISGMRCPKTSANMRAATMRGGTS